MFQSWYEQNIVGKKKPATFGAITEKHWKKRWS